jgi:hypothetical protein
MALTTVHQLWRTSSSSPKRRDLPAIIRASIGAAALTAGLACADTARSQHLIWERAPNGFITGRIEALQNLYEFNVSGSRSAGQLSIFPQPIESWPYIGDFGPTTIQRPGVPNASGHSTNGSRNGNSKVGFIDNGFFTGFQPVGFS